MMLPFMAMDKEWISTLLLRAVILNEICSNENECNSNKSRVKFAGLLLTCLPKIYHKLDKIIIFNCRR